MDNHRGIKPVNTFQGNSKLVAALIAAVLIVAGAAAAYYYNQTSPPVAVTPAPASITAEQAKTALITKAKIIFPNIQSQSLLAQLPLDLKALVPSAAATEIKTITYAGGKKGYTIEFLSPSALLLKYPSSYTIYLTDPRSEWKLISSVRANLFAFLELKHAKYSARISETYLNEDDTKVAIQVIEN